MISKAMDEAYDKYPDLRAKMVRRLNEMVEEGVKVSRTRRKQGHFGPAPSGGGASGFLSRFLWGLGATNVGRPIQG